MFAVVHTNIGTNVRPGVIWKQINVGRQVFLHANKNKQPNQLQDIVFMGIMTQMLISDLLPLHTSGNVDITK